MGGGRGYYPFSSILTVYEEEIEELLFVAIALLVCEVYTLILLEEGTIPTF